MAEHPIRSALCPAVGASEGGMGSGLWVGYPAIFNQRCGAGLDYSWPKHGVLAAAAEKDGSNTATFPAGDKSVMGISSTDPNDSLATGSNYGPSVFLGAPGVNIVGTYTDHNYVTWSG